MNFGLSDRDRQLIEAQLGRPARGTLRVETRCPAGHPQVLCTYPLVVEARVMEPFPTLFWLSCPSLHAQVARLEAEGLVGQLEDDLREDEDLRNVFLAQQRQYATERWELLSKQDRSLVEQRGWEPTLKDTGIGGVRRWDRVKCLHLHVAHDLARDNVLGAGLRERFVLRECPATAEEREDPSPGEKVSPVP